MNTYPCQYIWATSVFFINYTPPTAYFPYPSIARQLEYFLCLSQTMPPCSHTCIYIHLGKCFCRIDSQQWERKISACDPYAFSILFQASQLSIAFNTCRTTFWIQVSWICLAVRKWSLFKVTPPATASIQRKASNLVSPGGKCEGPSPRQDLERQSKAKNRVCNLECPQGSGRDGNVWEVYGKGGMLQEYGRKHKFLWKKASQAEHTPCGF